MTWEMDLRIMKKRYLEQGRKEGMLEGMREGREEGHEEMAQILREKYGMSESEIEELKKEAAAREATRKA